MKRLLYLLVVLPFASIQAQPTIVQSSAPTPGTTWTEVYIDEPGGISQGSSGANQTWDLTNASGSFGTDVLEFVSPSSVPDGLGAFFPDSDVALYFEEEDSTATFFKSETDGFYIDGFASNSVWVEPPFNFSDFDPDNLFIPFDFSYPDVRNNMSRNVITIDGGVPVQLRSTIISEMTADGYGTVILPIGTFNNILRMETIQYSIDSVFTDADMNGVFEFVSTDGPSPEEISYFWLQNADPMLLATVELEEDQSTVSYFSYLVSGATGTEENFNELGVKVYPNPSQGNFSIRTEWLGATSLRIIDLGGKDIYREQFISNGSTYDIALAGVSSGTYLVQLIAEQGISTTRLIIE